MGKKGVLFSLMLALIVLFTACNKEIKYFAPNKAQVDEFISDNSINALSIKETTDFTIVLFQNEYEYGYYTLHRDRNNKLYSSGATAIGKSKESPILIGSTSGETPLCVVIINNEDILKKAKEIEITYIDAIKDGTTQKIKEMVSGKGTIILCPKEKNKEPKWYTKLVIYDEEMTALHTYEQ